MTVEATLPASFLDVCCHHQLCSLLNTEMSDLQQYIFLSYNANHLNTMLPWHYPSLWATVVKCSGA